MRTINGLYNVATLVPVVCALLAILLLFFVYPLTRDKVHENGKILAERHSANAESTSEAAE